MRFRGKSIRRKIVALLLVPLVSLTALWGFSTVLTGRQALQLLDVAAVINRIGYPVEDVVRVIQKERRQSLVVLGDPRASAATTELAKRRAATDEVVREVSANASDPEVSEDLTPAAKRRLDSILEGFRDLGALRANVDQTALDPAQALELYNRLVDPCYEFLMNLHALEDVEMDKQGRALVGITRARETLSRQDAVIAAAFAAKRFGPEDTRAVSDLVAKRELLYELNLAILPAGERESFEQYWSGAESKPLRDAEEKIVATGPVKNPRIPTAAQWDEASTRVLDSLAAMGTAAGDAYQERVEPVAMNVLIKAAIAGILGFLALIVSLVLSVRIGRDLVRDLSRLRKEAHEASGVRLPAVMRRLAAGEHVDIETEAPRLEYEKDEVGQVGQALNTLQRAAVEAAVKQAELRRGVSEVFVNLARRNQVLLHRQLTLLDTMERRTEDTEELADLFRLDHMTTRMRRHAEGLVILSGAAPSRQWRKPVQLMDVVRAAVAEVEDYERIEVRRLPRLGISGPAVADITHLVAELLENATVFSPPHTAVAVHGEQVANGFTLEIHDRGLGMTPEALLDANLRIAETSEFELSDTDRLGLFVVSRLAQRHEVKVSLQPSPYGGTTAVVFLPVALLTEAPDTNGIGFRLDGAAKAAVTGGPAGALTGRSRSRGNGTPSRRPVPAGLLDGPVELEAPLGALGLDETAARGALGVLDGAGSRPGAGGGLPAMATLDDETPPGGTPRSTLLPPTGPVRLESARLDGPWPEGMRPGAGAVPLPRRRRTPTLVAEHGRRVDNTTGSGRRSDHRPAPNQPGNGTADPATNGAANRGANGARNSGTNSGTSSSTSSGAYGGANGGTTPGMTPGNNSSHRSGKNAGRNTGNGPEPGAVQGSGKGSGGLPRRVRQASLAPQLKKGPTAGATEPAPADRDAEEVRNRMSALQRGWTAGRNKQAEQSGTAAGTAAAAGPANKNENEGDGR
ncbi:histidine kinase [Streptomyces venezuelae]|uniref:histidine kinase n=1 Tax=Streptomyces venezuelae TaxID=54571 RepID=A0A5P2DAD3_STRVZ|nr:nitrate- and nitrite sensing domain-containing protein [Streptomyces venezuelae]QES51167.1 histidine kinase [Streptomyces venezuelae]